MKDQPIHRESPDTFGRNTQADLQLFRAMSQRSNERSEGIIVLGFIGSVIVAAGTLLYVIFS